jgi:signal peptidase I
MRGQSRILGIQTGSAGPTRLRRIAWLVSTLLAVAGLAVLRYRFQLFLVLGASMQPTLRSGDLLVIDKCAYENGQPLRGDVVVIRHGREKWVKRVVGLPGEEIELREGELLVNGHRMVEGHDVAPGSLEITKGRLLTGKFAVLGDSRVVWPRAGIHAIVTKNEIVGKVLFWVAMPTGRIGWD